VRISRIFAILAASVLLLCAPARADSTRYTAPSDSFELGLEGQWYQYREPDFVRLQGYGWGLDGTYTYNWSHWFVKANVIADFYKLDYSSNGTGTENGISDYKQDYRGLFGRTFAVSHAVSVAPYTGFGFRMLFDANGENLSSTGASGYDRQSEYLYLPLGVTGNIRLGKWGFRPTAEYDYLIQGWQTSYLSQVGFDNNIENRQNTGYGLRASLMIAPPVNFYNFSFGPYVRYWSIHDSDVQTLYFGGVPVATGLEPGNNTLEYGLEASLRF
jgi:hypothetical protein